MTRRTGLAADDDLTASLLLHRGAGLRVGVSVEDAPLMVGGKP